jgi:hypothetical protein
MWSSLAEDRPRHGADRWSRWRAPFTAMALFAALLFGGAARQGVASDAAPELLALPLLALLAFACRAQLRRQPTAIALALGLVAVPALQLIPLPEALWTAAPGRQIVSEVFAAAGVPPGARPLSLVPAMTLRSLMSLIPIVAVFLGVVVLDAASRLKLAAMIVACAAASALLAMLQVSGGAASDLYFFAVTNPGRGVGFFANANHFAALEYAALPFAAVLVAQSQARSPWLRGAAFGLLIALPLVGLALSGSRAAFGLCALAGIGAVGFVGERRRLIATLVLLGLLALGLTLSEILARVVNEDVARDARWSLAPQVFASARAYMPVGAGVGVFPAAFPLHERLADLTPEFVNRAHDDALELVFEGGAVSLMLAAAFFVWLGGCAREAIRRRGVPGGELAQAGLMAMALLLLHSLVDYPLRTIALGCVFAYCAALQFPADETPGVAALRWPWRRRRRRSRTRRPGREAVQA